MRYVLIWQVKIEGQQLSSLLSRPELDKLVKALSVTTFPPGLDVFEEGEEADALYVIRKGEASVTIDGKGHVATLGDGDFFGEMALLTDRPRGATVTALTPLTCLSLERSKFDALLGPNRQLLHSSTERRITQNALAPVRKGGAAPIEWRPFSLITSNPEVIPDQHTLDLAAVFGQVAVLTIPQGARARPPWPSEAPGAFRARVRSLSRVCVVGCVLVCRLSLPPLSLTQHG